MASFGLQDREATDGEAADGEANGEATESQAEGRAVPVAVLVHQSRSTINSFWTRQIAATVSHDGCRDHFGMDSLDCEALHFQNVNATIAQKSANQKIRKLNR